MPMNIYIETYGCQMNKHDSEILAGLLKSAGFNITDSLKKKVDIIILNTCAVRENAVQRIKGRLNQLKKYRNNNPGLKFGIVGCVAQSEGTSLIKNIEHLDFAVGPQNINEIAEIIKKTLENKSVSAVEEKFRELDYSVPHIRESKFKAWVSIINGCNNFCSYCIVPYVRYREISRSAEDIIKEVVPLLENGVKEITLLGQNVNSYGNDLEGNESFPQLIKRLSELNYNIWIRFVTSHPKDLSDELIEVMAVSDKICNQVHLPVQSGSNKILELMNRKYTREHYIKLVEKLRSAMPDISITTDLIVGFPGELEKDFKDTYNLVKEIKFDGTFTFKYSDRPGTKAASMYYKLSNDVIKRRHRELLELQKNISAEVNSKYINSQQKVLVESVSPKDKDYLSARNEYNKVVIFKGKKELIGGFCTVLIEEAKSWTLFGKKI